MNLTEFKKARKELLTTLKNEIIDYFRYEHVSQGQRLKQRGYIEGLKEAAILIGADEIEIIGIFDKYRPAPNENK